MRYKQGVKLTDLIPQLLAGLLVCQYVYEKLYAVELVVTSIDDSKHGAGSLHPKGAAADLRTRTLKPEQIPVVLSAIRERLTPEFDIIFEGDHFHIEYDPK